VNVASAGPYASLHCSRQITTPAPHHSVFYRPDALPAAQPTASKHWRQLVIKLKNKSYTDRLSYLNLPTLKYRHLPGDMIEVFKITHNIYDTTVSPNLSFNNRANTRGNNFSLWLTKAFYLSAHIVNIWNSLSNSVVDACTVNAFKARLNKFRQHQIVELDFRADPTSTRNRSEELIKWCRGVYARSTRCPPSCLQG